MLLAFLAASIFLRWVTTNQKHLETVNFVELTEEIFKDNEMLKAKLQH